MNRNFIFFILFNISLYYTNTNSEIIFKGNIPGEEVRLELKYIKNETEDSDYILFYGDSDQICKIFKKSTFFFEKPLGLDQLNDLTLICSTGNYSAIYIKDNEGLSSGNIENNEYVGPFYISMWLSYPNKILRSKGIDISYVLKKGTLGTIGIEIGTKGEVKIVAIENIKIL